MRNNQAVQPWSRQRLTIVVTAIAVVAVVLMIVLVVWLVRTVVTDRNTDTTSGTPNTHRSDLDDMFSAAPLGQAHRDTIANAPMATVTADDMFPADPAPTTLDGIEIPTGDVVGPAAVLTGFPRTPEGAIGQLAQLDIAVLQSMSNQVAAEVYEGWAVPGAMGLDDWWLTTSVQSFLNRTEMGESLAPTAAVEVQPSAAIIKGTDGPDWTTVCVLSKVHASYNSDADVAFGHCERMRWAGGRWMIAAGDAPATAPSTWPGTQAAVDAGWRPWITAGGA